jgi:hypothetical protein
VIAIWLSPLPSYAKPRSRASDVLRIKAHGLVEVGDRTIVFAGHSESDTPIGEGIEVRWIRLQNLRACCDPDLGTAGSAVGTAVGGHDCGRPQQGERDCGCRGREDAAATVAHDGLRVIDGPPVWLIDSLVICLSARVQ